jgi:hypothetical protein
MIEPIKKSHQRRLLEIVRQLGQRKAAVTVGLSRSTLIKAARGEGVYPSTRIVVRDYFAKVT